MALFPTSNPHSVICQAVQIFMPEMICKICHSFDAEDFLTCLEQDDYERAFKLALPLAENGNVVAQCSIGGLLQVGLGTKADDIAAEKWLRCAGEKGCGLAWHNLSILYLTGGEKLPSNSEKARECRDKAIENGFDLSVDFPSLKTKCYEDLLNDNQPKISTDVMKKQ